MLKDNGEIRDFAVRMYVSDISYDDAFFDGWFDRMPPARKERTLRYKRIPDRNRSICAWALLMYALADVSGRAIREEEIGISRMPSGKPFFTDIPICFNISHSKDRLAVALSGEDVGCDVECKSDAALKIAKRFFAEDELAFLAGIGNESKRALEFTKLWTLKESVVKCSGDGIRRPFDSFSLVDENGCKNRSIKLPGQDGTFYVKEFESEDIYCYSVCSLHDDMEDTVRRVRIPSRFYQEE